MRTPQRGFYTLGMLWTAIATGFALAVTYIDAGNIGGGGLMLTRGGGAFLDYREKRPSQRIATCTSINRAR